MGKVPALSVDPLNRSQTQTLSSRDLPLCFLRFNTIRNKLPDLFADSIGLFRL